MVASWIQSYTSQCLWQARAVDQVQEMWPRIVPGRRRCPLVRIKEVLLYTYYSCTTQKIISVLPAPLLVYKYCIMGWIMFDHVLLTPTYTLQKPSCYVRQQSIWLLQLCDYLYYARFMNAVLNKKKKTQWELINFTATECFVSSLN